MGKSKIAILVITIILILGVGGVTFAAFSVTRGATIDINTGDSVSVEIAVDSDIFKSEAKSQLVPREAHVLYNNGLYLDEKVNNAGINNKTAFMGKFTVKIQGDKVDRLKFNIGKVLVYDKATNQSTIIEDKLELFFLKGYNESLADRYRLLDGSSNLPVNQKDAPHYLGAIWDSSVSKYVGGSINESEAVGPFVANVQGLHTFTLFVRFKEAANNVSNNLNNKVLSFELNVAAL